jgi:SAM-dependent methyltransferase
MVVVDPVAAGAQVDAVAVVCSPGAVGPGGHPTDERGMNDREQGIAWSGAAYADHADHHRAVDDWFLDRLRPEPDSVVVDLGSGSGEFSARLAAVVTRGRVIGVEPDPSMLQAARRHTRDNLQFVGASAEDVDRVVEPGSADIVVSRAMLHWLPLTSYPRVFDAVRRVLRPGGWYHSESAGAGNVPLVSELLVDLAARFDLPALPAFPDAGVVFDLVEQAGFELPVEGVRTVAQRRPFSRQQMLGFLRSQATVVLTRAAPADAHDAIVQAAVADVDRLRRADDTYDQTFVRLEILARRPAI